MISAIEGKLARVQEDRVTVRVGGLSYDVLVSPATARALYARRDEDVRLETICYVQGAPGKGNMLPVLVGFMTQVDKEFFEHFITVGGIGPRAALRAMSVPAHRVARAIENEDVVALSSLPGIGKQKAAKIVAELKGKVTRFALAKEDAEGAEGAEGEAAAGVGPAAAGHVASEAAEVLLQLGYKRQEAEEMIRQALSRKPDLKSAEDVIQEVYRSSQQAKEVARKR